MYIPEWKLTKKFVIADEQTEYENDYLSADLIQGYNIHFTQFDGTFDTLYWLLRRTKANPLVSIEWIEYVILEMVKVDSNEFLIKLKGANDEKTAEITVLNPDIKVCFLMDKTCIDMLKEYAKSGNISYTTFLESKIRRLNEIMQRNTPK